jgi:F420-dependent oxidoreductase-like protein
VIYGPDTAAVVETIAAAEAAGVRQAWMTQGAAMPDTLIGFAAAALRTSTVRLGTAIVPTYPRHPLALAQQALAVADLAPGRLRLGIGPSHRPTIEGAYGLPMGTPLAHLREYLTVLRGLLWEGAIDHQGDYYQVRGGLPRTPQVPLLVSALRANAFHLAGELSDGAISWLCPVPYLLEEALPALRAGAAAAGRPAPPLVAHLSVALSEDRAAVVTAARQTVARYARLPFYARMFADAGYPLHPDGSVSPELIDDLVVSGTPDEIATQLRHRLDLGFDVLMVNPLRTDDDAAHEDGVLEILGGL